MSSLARVGAANESRPRHDDRVSAQAAGADSGVSGVQADRRRYALGQRFVDPGVERDYRRWRRDATFSVMWLGMWAASLSWLSLPWALQTLAPELYPQLRGLILYFLLPVYLSLSLAGFLPAFRRHALATVCIANCASGLAMIWMSYGVGASPGAAVAAIVLVLFYAPFMRLPPGLTALSTAPYVFTALAIVVAEFDALQLPVERITYAIVPVLSLVTVIVVCGVLEFLLRDAYVRDCLIRAQQHQLENAARQIRRYVPQAVADEIIDGDGAAVDRPQRRRVTVLFCDLVGFTDAADRLDPEALTEVLGEYMATMARLIEDHGGTLNEFAGDGLMALFGAPAAMAPQDQVRAAVAAARDMQARLPALNQGWRRLGLDSELACRIGINTGMVSVGSYGAEGRMTYTAIGLQTNIAARLEAAAEPGQILLSETSWSLLEGEIEAAPRGEVACKGVHYPVRVYAVG